MILSSFVVFGRHPLLWLQGLVLGFICLLAGCGGSSADVSATPATRTAAVTAASGATQYTATIISGGGRLYTALNRKFINASGQVAFLETDTSNGRVTRALFYDGTTIHEISGAASGTAITSLNDAGEVVGFKSAGDGSSASHAFFWSIETGMIDLGTLGGRDSLAWDINASGQVIGQSQINDDPDVSHGFVWTQATGMVDMGPQGPSHVIPRSLNSQGQATGGTWLRRTSGNQGLFPRAFVWSPETGIVDLGTLGANQSEGLLINAAGQIAGRASLAGDSVTHSFFWAPATGMIDVGKLAGFFSSPVDINASGTIVGNSTVDDIGRSAPYVWKRETGIRPLPSLMEVPSGQVLQINSSGFAVGSSIMRGPDFLAARAVLWTPEDQIIDLNTRLVSPPEGMQWNFAYAINDKGMIVAGTGAKLVLLRPVKNPPVITALIALSPAQTGTSVQASVTWADTDAEQAY